MRHILLAFAALCMLHPGAIAQGNQQKKWKEIYQITRTIKEPVTAGKTINIADMGAVGDGQTKNTEIFRKAIDLCSAQGGGKVVVPAGKFLTGAIHMKSHVNLYISKGASILFSTEPADYLPVVETRWEGNDCFNYSPLIYANNQNNWSITGEGTIDGQGSATYWWPWKGIAGYGWQQGTPSQLEASGRPLLTKYDNQQTPVAERQMGDGHYLRPQLINFTHCQNVKLEGVTLTNSPFWVIHPLLSENVIIRRVTINSMGPNSDGCDPESCKNVLIDNCTFNTGDDCIALKSGRNFDGRKVNIPNENILIRNCKMRNGHGGVVLGSEVSGGCRNIFAENCEMSSPELERAIRLKTNSLRGGVLDGLYIRNIKVGEVKEAVVIINCNYDPKEGQGSFFPKVQNVYISGLNAEKAKYALLMTGIEGQNCIENINISNCTFNGVSEKNKTNFVKNLHLEKVKVNGKAINN